MTAPAANPKAYRLPHHVSPTSYDIELDARLGRPDFHGAVTIQLDIKESRDTIELHALELKINSATLTMVDGTFEGTIKQDQDREMAEISFSEPLQTGSGTLRLTFDGEVSKGLEGLYHAQDGPEQCLCTQCEETDARKIFPCFDEPTFKATFAWKITTAADATVLANGPLLSVEDGADGSSKTWSFAPTKPMSSYLVALVIGDMASTPEETVNGTPIRVFALRGKEHMGRFAHDYTKRLLPWYEEYFGVPYHYDKYDQVAVPGFSAGAMENAGLVLFRQSALILNPQTSSWNAEKNVAHVVAHEFAHMWFGDLVTMNWWDDLWLNEAFAEWISTKALNVLSPDYDVWNDFQGGRISAMASDALESTHPIYNHVETPAQATEMFDVITYQKGCAVMRMLESFLGEDAFRAGIRTYMKEFAESNASGADLWRHLEQAAGHPVTAVMESWVAQGGFPLIDVSLNGTTLSLSQRRFFSDPNAGAANSQTWQVPVLVHYEDNTGTHEVRYLLQDKEGTLNLEVDGALKWCYANADEIGFYRQNPDDALLKMLLDNLDRLTPLEQMGLLSDQWAAVRNGTSTINRFLDTLSALNTATNHNVLEMVVGYLHSVETLLEEVGDAGATDKFRAWVDSTFSARMSALSYEPKAGESQNDAQSRVSLVNAMTTLAHNPNAEKQAREWADREAENPALVDPNLAGAFVGASAQFGDEARFDKYVQVYRSRVEAQASPQERGRYLGSFALFQNPELIQKTFQLMDDKVLAQEAVGPVLRQMFGLRHAQVPAWEYVKSHWGDIRTLGDMWTGNLVSGAGNLPISMRDDVVKFLDANLNGVASQSYARALETMDQLAEFRARTKAELLAWFSNK